MIDFEREGPATTDTKQHTVALFMVYGFLSFENWAADNRISCKNEWLHNSHKTWFEADLSVARDREHFCLFHASLNGIFWLKPAHPPW